MSNQELIAKSFYNLNEKIVLFIKVKLMKAGKALSFMTQLVRNFIAEMCI